MTAPEIFSHLQPAAADFQDLGARWFFCGGTALDLFMERPLRPRLDIDIGIFRADQLLLWQRFAGRGLFFVDPRQKAKLPWSGEALRLPVHELYIGDGADALEVLLNEADELNWIYRRDARITLPLCMALRRGAAGLEYLAPEIVLLYKSKHMRPQDELDFGFVKAALPPEARQWLDAALSLTAPGHAWRQALQA